ncbi:MAG: FAD-dependent oxidoreductase [Phycisphaerae bacterium]|nr:FAD-dependent oxidoreductase [Phycisphaerae bacterium]
MTRRLMIIVSVVICAAVSLAAGASVLVEAESFTVKGGWVVDQQYMDMMGSPYLLAHGLGEPVADAVTTVEFPSSGTYRVWVRTKNWVPGPWEAPGQFRVVIDGESLGETFGTKTGWTWQDGGTVVISKKQVEVRLADLTGFEGRCDAIYFDTDKSSHPLDFDADKPNINRQWRNKLRGLPGTPVDGGTFDVVIVGGGISGCAAALAAEQQGLRVALIHDRMALGGNASREIRVHTEGIYGAGKEILEKIDTKHYPNGSAKAIADEQKRQKTMAAAKGVTMFRPYRAYDVQMNGAKIVSVDACSTVSGEALRIRSGIFIDCTGDGWIGYWAGAEYRYGRESQNEFDEAWSQHGELWSPEKADHRVMGSSLLWYSSPMKSRSTFPEVPWAMDVAKTKSALSGEWFWEYTDNNKHMIDDAEEIRDHMFRAIYGSFYNAKKESKNANRKLDWMGYLNGKRESRRLIGDYIYKQRDAMSGTLFDDAVAQEVRSIDVHYQMVLKDSPYDFLSRALFRKVPRYYIPFRCLYSKNIDNLMMAGRCFSCTHIGLGGPRVMLTCGQMGIATGYAASLCKQYDTTPRGVYRKYIAQLKDLVQENR